MSQIPNMLESTIQKIREMVDVNSVIGEPISTPDGVTIIPVSKVSVGFGGGGSDFTKKTTAGDNPFGGGVGGGVKVTTFAVLLLAILAEARGDQDIEAFGRRITPSTVRLSVAVAFIGSSIIGLATLLLLQMTNLSLDRILFEVISAFATVGLSTGITPSLPDGAKYVIVALMFVGRVGTMTAASALALRERRRVIRMPEASPMIG